MYYAGSIRGPPNDSSGGQLGAEHRVLSHKEVTEGRAFYITRKGLLVRHFIVTVKDRDRNEIEVPIEALTRAQAIRQVSLNLRKEYYVANCVEEVGS